MNEGIYARILNRLPRGDWSQLKNTAISSRATLYTFIARFVYTRIVLWRKRQVYPGEFEGRSEIRGKFVIPRESEDTETKRGDIDHDGHLWLRPHGWKFVTGVTRDQRRWHADGERREN